MAEDAKPLVEALVAIVEASGAYLPRDRQGRIRQSRLRRRTIRRLCSEGLSPALEVRREPLNLEAGCPYR